MKIKEFSIRTTIITTISIILVIAVCLSVFIIFNIITSKTKALVYDQASEINKQIVLNYENYTNGVKDIMTRIQKRVIMIDAKNEYTTLREFFLNLEEIEPDIEAIALFDNSGEVIVSTQTIGKDSKKIAVKNWFRNAIYEDDIIHFSAPHEQDIFEIQSDEVITASKEIKYVDEGMTKNGVLLIDMNFESLDSLSKITNLGETGHILIVDDNDNLIYSSDRQNHNTKSKSYTLIKEKIFGRATATINGTSMAMNINTISSTRWRIATFQNIDSVNDGMNQALLMVVGLGIVAIISTILIASFVARKITDPLTKLDNAIIDFQHGNYTTKVAIEGQKEVKIVSQGFNDMIDEIQRLMDEVVKEQEGKRHTEISVLQNQINPHFLYNTLDCIIWLAEKKRNDDLVSTVNALSTYFRVSLSKGKQFIPISEELKHIESYMLIQTMRYNDIFEYTITCEAQLEKLKIMKLLLQPLVENAIYHGIDKDEDDGYIHVNIYEQNENVFLSVTNNGYGISASKIQEIYKGMEEGNAKGSIGMKNVYQRIKLFYGDQARIHIESELDESTTISIIIAKAKLEEQE
ncbi:sensor histidine kinase [Vallitaleaceae bacterium 9-2]